MGFSVDCNFWEGILVFVVEGIFRYWVDFEIVKELLVEGGGKVLWLFVVFFGGCL